MRAAAEEQSDGTGLKELSLGQSMLAKPMDHAAIVRRDHGAGLRCPGFDWRAKGVPAAGFMRGCTFERAEATAERDLLLVVESRAAKTRTEARRRRRGSLDAGPCRRGAG